MRISRKILSGLSFLALCGCGGSSGREEPAAERPAFTVESEAAPAGGSESEAERARQMEEQARAIDERQRELVEGGASGAELERAAQELEAERQRLIQGESGEAAEAEGGDYEPPPPR